MFWLSGFLEYFLSFWSINIDDDSNGYEMHEDSADEKISYGVTEWYYIIQVMFLYWWDALIILDCWHDDKKDEIDDESERAA